MFATVINWFEERLKLGETLGPSMTHSVPTSARWWYVFGSATLTCRGTVNSRRLFCIASMVC